MKSLVFFFKLKRKKKLKQNIIKKIYSMFEKCCCFSLILLRF